MKVLSLFDGISCGRVALDKIGVKPDKYYAYEIDKVAKEISKKNYPDIIQCGDVTTEDFTKYKGDIDLLMGGSPCFTEETLVLTKEGFKTIKEVKVGDLVYTHMRRFRKVTECMHSFAKKVYHIQSKGVPELVCTVTHPFWCRFGDEPARWRPAYELNARADVCCAEMKPFKAETEENRAAFWYIAGFLDNVVATRHKGTDELDVTMTPKQAGIIEPYLKKIKIKYVTSYVSKYTHSFHIYTKGVPLLFDVIRGKKHSHYEERFWNLPQLHKLSYLKGMYETYGYSDISGHHMFLRDAETAYLMKMFVIRLFNVAPELIQHPDFDTDIQHKFELIFKPSDSNGFEDGYAWEPFVKKTEETVTCHVYNLEVEEDHSYTANTLVVHNCQDLSGANQKGEGLQGKRSGLFWEYVRALKEAKPKYFLFENVASMKAKDKRMISAILECEPIMIDSSKLSGQSRKRLYWTNIPVEQPEDKGIVLSDILEDESVVPCALRTRKDYIGSFKRLECRKDGKANALTTVQTDSMVCKPIRLGDLYENKAQGGRVYSVKGKSVALQALSGGLGAKTGLYRVDLPDGDYIVRRLTPTECERLQTLPDGYTEGFAYGKRVKALGNGWTADVIAHILKGVPEWN